MTRTYNALTTAQKICVIDNFLKVKLMKTGDSSYEVPAGETLASLARQATNELGFPVTPPNITGCLDTMQAIGFTIERQRKSAPASERLADLEARVAVLEHKLALVSGDAEGDRHA
jgi:hypothetical protein